MSADLETIKAKLADLAGGELQALLGAANHVPQIVPGLLAWIDTACGWELNRRCGFDAALQAPDAAIPLNENADSIAAATALRATFDNDSPAMRALFDVLVDVLTSAEQRR